MGTTSFCQIITFKGFIFTNQTKLKIMPISSRIGAKTEAFPALLAKSFGGGPWEHSTPIVGRI